MYAIRGPRRLWSDVPMSESEASRFLMHATLGPRTVEEITSTAGRTPRDWISSQIAIPVPSDTLYEMAVNRGPAGDTGVWSASNVNTVYQALSHRFFVEPDVLRSRVLCALSELFVCSFTGQGSFIYAGAMAAYLDILAAGAFGSFRTMLEGITRSIEMSFYLTHFRNEKAAGADGRQPDENYAREIMQLFSIGLWELRMDGTRKPSGELDPADPRYVSGGTNDVPTYVQSDIAQMARVFTGLCLPDSFGDPDWGLTNPAVFAASAEDGWRSALVFDPTKHETGAKLALNGLVNIPADTAADTGLGMAIDALTEHPSTAPFISKRLITLLTNSNPSKNYVRRVAEVFADDGLGVVGNMAAVITAILTDNEARAPRTQARIGRVEDIQMQFYRFRRAVPNGADAVGTTLAKLSGTYPGVNDLATSLEAPLNFGDDSRLTGRSPSVFGRWPATFSPPGPVLSAGIVAPEMFQIDEGGASDLFNMSTELLEAVRNTTPATDMALIGSNPTAVVDRLLLLLTANSHTDAFRTAAIAALTAETRSTDDQKRAAYVSIFWMIGNGPFAKVRT